MKSKLLCPNCGHHIADFVAPTTASSRGRQATAASDDTVEQFIQEKCRRDKTRRVETKDFRTAYVKWCEEQGMQPLAPQTMGRVLASLSHVRAAASNGKRYYTGITFV